jgi:hypothetical protein
MADERIISETNLGSSGFFGRFGRNFSESLRGVGGGFISVAIGILIIYFTAGSTEYSKIVQELPLTPAESVVSSQTGLVKISGKPVLKAPLVAPKSTTAESVIYYRSTVEEYRKVEKVTTETRTVQKEGQDVSQQVEKKEWIDAWVPKTEPVEKWADFTLVNVSVEPAGSEKYFNYKEVSKTETPVSDPNPTIISQITYQGKSANAYPATKIREIVTAVPADQPIIVVGEINSGSIRSGKPFIVSNKSNGELIDSMKSKEKMWYWITKGLAWLFIAGGLTAILGPIFAALDILPGLGGALKSIVFIINGIIAAVIVFLGTLIIEYWYVVVGVIVALIALLILLRKKKA